LLFKTRVIEFISFFFDEILFYVEYVLSGLAAGAYLYQKYKQADRIIQKKSI